MGKLHKLRRAIRENPENWYSRTWGGSLYIRGARFFKGRPKPSSGFLDSGGYKNFIKKELVSLGIPLVVERKHSVFRQSFGGTWGTREQDVPGKSYRCCPSDRSVLRSSTGRTIG